VFGQPNCFHLLKGRLLIGFHSPPVTRNPLLLLCDRAQPENSTISSNFRAIWFAGRPTRKSLRACLRHPISPPPSDSVRPSASPEWRRLGKYFDLRLPFGAAPFGPTFGCSSYRLPLRAVKLYELEASPSVPALARQLGVSVHFLSFLQNSLLRNAIPFVLWLLVGFALCISNTGQFSTMARIPPARPSLQALPPWQSFPNRGCTAQSSLPVDGHR